MTTTNTSVADFADTQHRVLDALQEIASTYDAQGDDNSLFLVRTEQAHHGRVAVLQIAQFARQGYADTMALRDFMDNAIYRHIQPDIPTLNALADCYYEFAQRLLQGRITGKDSLRLLRFNPGR